jgi:hypothetical protein
MLVLLLPMLFPYPLLLLLLLLLWQRDRSGRQW